MCNLRLVSGPAIPNDEFSIQRSTDQVATVAGEMTTCYLSRKYSFFLRNKIFSFLLKNFR